MYQFQLLNEIVTLHQQRIAATQKKSKFLPRFFKNKEAKDVFIDERFYNAVAERLHEWIDAGYATTTFNDFTLSYVKIAAKDLAHLKVAKGKFLYEFTITQNGVYLCSYRIFKDY